MKKQLTTLLLLAATTTFAQEEATTDILRYSKRAVKAYITTTLAPYEDITTVNQTGTQLRIKNHSYFQPSVAYDVFNKRGNYHEIALASLFFHSSSVRDSAGVGGLLLPQWGGYDYRTFNIALSYEYAIVYRKSKKLQPVLGFAASPFYRQTTIFPISSAQYPVKRTAVGITTFLVPRVQYAISQRVYLDANMPIYLTETAARFEKRQNPTLPIEQQQVGIFDIDAQAKPYSLRLGVMVKL